MYFLVEHDGHGNSVKRTVHPEKPIGPDVWKAGKIYMSLLFRLEETCQVSELPTTRPVECELLGIEDERSDTLILQKL